MKLTNLIIMSINISIILIIFIISIIVLFFVVAIQLINEYNSSKLEFADTIENKYIELKNDKLKIKFSYPKEWGKFQERELRDVVSDEITYLELRNIIPVNNGDSFSLFIIGMQYNSNLYNIFQSDKYNFLKEISSGLKKTNLIEMQDVSEITIDGYKAYSIQYTNKPLGSSYELFNKEIYLCKNNNLYNMHWRVDLRYIDIYSFDINELISTIKFIK